MANFLAKYRDDKTHKLHNFTAAQFAEVWTHYDSDGNGFIEGKELDSFLKEFITSVMEADKCLDLTDEALDAMKKEFMATFDENSDNKIEISELARILPTDENFLLLFRRENPVESSAEFMRIWKNFDKDHNGYIDADELQEFLLHLIKETQPHCDLSPEKLAEYTKSTLKIFDANGDGKLQLSEMARLLPIKENFLTKPIFKNAENIRDEDIDRAFQHYDRDGNGTIENEELSGFLKDLLASSHEAYTDSDLAFWQRVILEQWDVDHNGKIDKEELKMLLTQQRRLAALEAE